MTEEAQKPHSPWKGVLVSLFINAFLPWLLFTQMKARTDWSDLNILLLTSIFPIVGAAIGLYESRRLDIISGITMVGIVVSIGALLAGGDPKLLLIRESFMTLALGIWSFASLLFFPRPLLFYFARQGACGYDTEKIRDFESKWQYPGFRRLMNRITLVWGVVFVLEFAAKVLMVYKLEISQVLVAGPIVNNAATLGTLAWTLAYGGRARRAAEARMAAQKTAEESMTPPSHPSQTPDEPLPKE